MKSTGSVVIIDNPDGSKKRWHRISDRLAEFNREYPLTEGYRVVIEKRDALSYQKGLMQLYEARLKAGHSVEGSGLPSIDDSSSIVMEASLLGKEGKVLASATSLKKILQEKDWEKLETNVRHRLLEVLGYSGELLDGDETSEMQRLGGGSAAKGTEPETPAPCLSQPPAVTEEKEPEKVTLSDEKPATAVNTLKSNKVPASVYNQIVRLCAKRGVETIPEFHDANAALRYLADLRNPPTASKAAGF